MDAASLVLALGAVLVLGMVVSVYIVWVEGRNDWNWTRPRVFEIGAYQAAIMGACQAVDQVVEGSGKEGKEKGRKTMTQVLTKLFSGFSRSIAIWVSTWLASHNIITGADSANVEAAIGVVVCGVLWAAIHAIEDKLKSKKEG